MNKAQIVMREAPGECFPVLENIMPITLEADDRFA